MLLPAPHWGCHMLATKHVPTNSIRQQSRPTPCRPASRLHASALQNVWQPALKHRIQEFCACACELHQVDCISAPIQAYNSAQQPHNITLLLVLQHCGVVTLSFGRGSLQGGLRGVTRAPTGISPLAGSSEAMVRYQVPNTAWSPSITDVPPASTFT